jgi:HSP20 family protein
MRIRELIPWQSRQREQGELSPRGANDRFTALHTQMNRLFDQFLEGFDMEPFGRGGHSEWGGAPVPKVDVAETEDSVHVTAELPGMKEDNIDVTLSDGNLVIRGEKKAEKEDKQKNYYRVERSYGSFQRSIPLPAEVDDQKVDASFKDGVLNIVLPKVTPSKTSKKIAVKRSP